MFERFPFGRWSCLFCVWLVLIPCEARAQTKEYQVKAAFLLNFAQFVEWPEAAFSGSDAPLCIGILGDDPFGPAVEQVLNGESIGNHKLTIKRAQRIEDLTNCQMVFVCKSENKRVQETLDKVGSHPVVTVSEVPGFAEQGGTINFYREQNKVRFEINAASALKSGLKISSQLLRLGKIVEPSPNHK
jgi:hypothetical protein